MNKIYHIKDSPGYFRAAKLPNANQVLIGNQGSAIVQITFDEKGNLLQIDTSTCDVGDESETFIERLLSELKASPSTIRVKKFSIPERSIEILDEPPYLASQEGISPERKLHLQKALADWRERGGFVLNWDEEYEMTKYGEIEST